MTLGGLINNLQNLSTEIWLTVIGAIIVLTLLTWWFHHELEFEGIELPFKLKFKRRAKPLPTPPPTPPPSPTYSAQRDLAMRDIVRPEGDAFTANDEATINFYPPPPPPIEPQTYVPASTSSAYIPRGDIENNVRQRLLAEGVAAIVGVYAPGGEGKTELARHAAQDLEQYFDGIVWVILGDKTHQQVISDLMARVGVRPEPSWVYDQQVEAVKAAFAKHHFLLVLDDARSQHVAYLADFIAPRPCAVLVTSRIRSFHAVPANATFELDMMTPPQARILFETVVGSDAVQAEAEAAASLARRCAYNALALDIAARRIRTIQRAKRNRPVRLFLDQLEARGIRELQDGSDPRSNLTEILGVSYNDLSEADRRRLRWAAIFAPSGFSPVDAASVWGEAEAEAQQACLRLQDLSLLQISAGDAERYRLHDLLREYAQQKLDEHGESGSAGQALCQHIVKLFETYAVEDMSTAPQVALELDNLRAAVVLASRLRNGSVLARLATAPRNWLYNIFRINVEWLGWLQLALKLEIEEKALKANVLRAIGDVQQFRDERDAALQSYEQALGLYRAVGAKLGEANVLQAIGDVQQFRDERDAALQSYEQALGLFRAVGDRLGEANVLDSMGRMAIFSGEGEKGLALLQTALNLHEAIGNLPGQANTYFFLSQLIAGTEQADGAIPLLEKAVELGERIDPAHPATLYMKQVLDETRAKLKPGE